jgi:hypothetical protein
MPADCEKKTGKKSYRKPRLRTIELVADEVLAVGCKVQNGTSAVNNAPKQSCALPTVCYGEGS